MDFTIIGAGNMGRGIATRLLSGGNSVVLAVYYPSEPAILAQYGNQLSGKIVVEITNPLNETFDDLAIPPGSSAAEELAKKAPAGTRVVKAFNTLFAGTLAAGQVAGQPLDVFIAGDDAQAKERLSKAFSASGLRPIDVGPLRRARQLEGLGLLHITLQGSLGTNWASSIKVLA